MNLKIMKRSFISANKKGADLQKIGSFFISAVIYKINFVSQNYSLSVGCIDGLNEGVSNNQRCLKK